MSLCQQLANCTTLSNSSTKAQFENHAAGPALSPEVTVSLVFGITMFILAAYGLWQGRQRLNRKSKELPGFNRFCFCFANFYVDDDECYFSEWPRPSERSHPGLELGSEEYLLLYPHFTPAITTVRLLTCLFL